MFKQRQRTEANTWNIEIDNRTIAQQHPQRYREKKEREKQAATQAETVETVDNYTQ